MGLLFPVSNSGKWRLVSCNIVFNHQEFLRYFSMNHVHTIFFWQVHLNFQFSPSLKLTSKAFEKWRLKRWNFLFWRLIFREGFGVLGRLYWENLSCFLNQKTSHNKFVTLEASKTRRRFGYFWTHGMRRWLIPLKIGEIRCQHRGMLGLLAAFHLWCFWRITLFRSKAWVHLLRCLVLRISWLQLGVWTFIRNWSNTTDTDFVNYHLFCHRAPQRTTNFSDIIVRIIEVRALKLYPPVKPTAKTSEKLVVSLYTLRIQTIP